MYVTDKDGMMGWAWNDLRGRCMICSVPFWVITVDPPFLLVCSTIALNCPSPTLVVVVVGRCI